MKSEELDYVLPPELIAQRPAERRDDSRLLVFERATRQVRHRRFADLPEEVGGALVVVNDTRVVPARIPIERPKGEVLLLEPAGEDGVWEALARPTRRLRAGERYGPVLAWLRQTGLVGPEFKISCMPPMEAVSEIQVSA